MLDLCSLDQAMVHVYASFVVFVILFVGMSKNVVSVFRLKKPFWTQKRTPHNFYDKWYLIYYHDRLTQPVLKLHFSLAPHAPKYMIWDLKCILYYLIDNLIFDIWYSMISYCIIFPKTEVFFQETGISLLRLAIAWILRCEFGLAMALFAVCCSSFVPVNRGTGARSLLTPLGDMLVPSVRRSNKLMSRTGVASASQNLDFWENIENSESPSPDLLPWRTVLLQTLLIAAGGIFALENPQNSLIALHDRWVWLLNTLLRFDIQAYHSCYMGICFKMRCPFYPKFMVNFSIKKGA